MTKTMTPDLAGTVTVSQFAQHTAAVLRAVRDNAQVPITVSGRLVAVLQPVDGQAGWDRIAAGEVELVGSRELEQHGPSRWVRRVGDGETIAVTYQNVPFAVLIPAAEWTELDDLFRNRDVGASGEKDVPDDALHERGS